MDKMIPLSVPNFEGNERKYVDEAIDAAWVSTGGAFISRLEAELAKFIHASGVAACQSGTAAIHLSLIDAGVSAGDVVLVPTLTFIAAVNPVRYQGAVPVFMDCDDSLCMDPLKLQEFCETQCTFVDGVLKFKGKAVKALIVVHVFGNMADMEHIMEIAGKYGLKVIEDATEALGTYYTVGRYKGCYAGTIGDYGAYSFNGNKIITTGGGGAVTAMQQSAVDHMRYLSTQAKDDPHFYIHDEVGYNYRMTNLQAALGVAQLEELPEFIRRKQRNYKMYCELLAGCGEAKILGFRAGVSSNQWFYSLDIDVERCGTTVREIISELQEKGVQTRAIWGLIHQQKPYSKEVAYRIEKAEYYSGRMVNIPCSTNLTEDDVKYVSGTVLEVLRKR